MRTFNLDSLIKKLQMVLMAISMLLPGFVHYAQKPHLASVNHSDRLNYARQVLSNKDYVEYAFHDAQKGEVEAYLLKKFKAAFPEERQALIYSWVNTLINESNRAGIDPLFVAAIIQQESRFNAKAGGGHGELGRMQIRPQTARWMAKKAKVKFKSDRELFNPSVNIKIGVLYLSYLNKKFENVRHSTAAYNMGPRNVKRVIASQKQPQIYHRHVFRHYRAFYKELSAQKEALLVAYQDNLIAQ